VGQQRVIAITGVSRGLGRAMVKQFVERGHLVCGCARSADAIKRLSRQFGPPHQFDTLDVSDDAQVQVWCERILSAAHAPDLLLNNAGLINRPAPLWKTPPEEFQGIIDVNIRGVYHVARHFLPGMIERGVGVLVNFTSTWGRSTSPEVAPYCCSKWAIEGLTRSLADELPAGLAAIPFNPGIINTEMLKICFGDSAAAYPSADQWASRTVPYLLQLSSRDNGRPLTAPS
jgi:NAD(P)-dependent dehydrogenase (short-subunit alcohol dehydrogenase family)